MAEMRETHYLIAGVNIDGITGKLRGGQGVRHWVVVDMISPVGNSQTQLALKASVYSADGCLSEYRGQG